MESRGRRSYTLQYKLNVVKWLEEHGSSLRQASKHFGITRRVIRTWFEQRDQLREALDLNDPNKRKLHSGRPPASEELDKRVLDFLVNQRGNGVNVSDYELRSKALEVAYQMCLTGFKANVTWLRRWKHRCGVEFQNGTNDIALKVVKSVKSSLLSHVDSSEQIKLIVQHNTTDSFDMTQISQGPVYLDFTTSEHNYCQKAHQPSMFIANTLSGHIGTTEEELYNPHGLHCHHLGSEQDISTLSQSSETDNHLLGDITTQGSSSLTTICPSGDESGLELMIPTGTVVQELVEGLELPLGHEEVVGETSGGRDGELIITQAAASISPTLHRDHCMLTDHSLSNQDQLQSQFTSATSPSQQQTLLSASFSRETRLQELASLQNAQDYLTEVNTFLQEPRSSGEPTHTPGSKSRGGKKRYQSKRGSSHSRVTRTKANKSSGQGSRRGARAVTPVATFPNLMLDDPQGYSGLLASRLSQPVFPGEPEFVYTDMATSH